MRKKSAGGAPLLGYAYAFSKSNTCGVRCVILINECRLISETDVGMSTCSLTRDGRTMRSASSTGAVVESQRRGYHSPGGPRSLKGESPFVWIS